MLDGIETEENILRFLDSADLSFHFFKIKFKDLNFTVGF